MSKTMTLGLLCVSLCASPSALGSSDREPAAVGQAAPRFKLRALDGTLVRLDELAYPGKEKSWAKKRALLVDFFRTDCGPCRKALPELVRIHERYRGKGLEVVMIALLEGEQGRAKLERFLASEKLPFRVVVDDTEHFAKQYLGGSAKLPATFLIDSGGVIRATRFKGGEVEKHFSQSIDQITNPDKGASQ